MTAPPPLSPPENVVTLEMESLPDDVMSVHVEEVSVRRPGQLSSEFVWIGETDITLFKVLKLMIFWDLLVFIPSTSA